MNKFLISLLFCTSFLSLDATSLVLRNFLPGSEQTTIVVPLTESPVRDFAVNDYGYVILYENGIVQRNNEIISTGASSGNIEQISVCSDELLLLDDNGEIIYQGNNSTLANVPQDINFKSISLERTYALAVTEDGEIVGWGSDPYPSVPAISGIPNGNGFTKVEAAAYYAAAVKEDGEVVSWGKTYGGRLNTQGLSGIIDIALSYKNALALTDDGSLEQWGSNGITGPPPSESGYGGFELISSTNDFNMSINNTGQLFFWGKGNGFEYIKLMSNSSYDFHFFNIYRSWVLHPIFKFELNADGDSYKLVSVSSSIEQAVVPPTYNGLPVTTIGEEAFAFLGPHNLTSVEIPESVTTIGDYAFWSCSSLTSIEIPESVTTIGDYAFESCYNLENIVFLGEAFDFSGSLDLTSDTLIKIHVNPSHFNSFTDNSVWDSFEILAYSDLDGDGVIDVLDAFPYNPLETIDSDGDGVGDNSDDLPFDASGSIDSDGDGIGDNIDAFPYDTLETTDTDGDGIGDNSDAFPLNYNETHDSDGDGVGDNSDIFPNDSTETHDSDEDGVGDNSDIFPNDSTETHDSDGDGVGDNADVFPNDSTEIHDSDSDGVGDNSDIFPNDSTETHDSDGDGIGDNADLYSGYPDTIISNFLSNENYVNIDDIKDLRPGSTMIQISENQATIQLQMEESYDLQTWEDTGTPATMTVPADTDTKFFRFKMAE